jgi:CPA2 family monovalent cation:H+ antiporter-2
MHVIRRVQESRAGRYAAFSGYLRTSPNNVENESLQPRFLSVLLKDKSAAVGKKLNELALAKLSVEVNAVRRRNEHDVELNAEMILETGDILVLLGLPEALLAAESQLHKGQ